MFFETTGGHLGRFIRGVTEMMDLDKEERAILADVLDATLADLRMEIGRTDRQDYRLMLKKRKAVLEKAVAHLRGDAVSQMGNTGQGAFHL